MRMRRQAGWVLLAVALLLAGCSAGPARPPAAGANPGAPPAGAAGAATAVPAAPVAPAAAKPASDYYAGKTLTMLVNFSAGGPTDIFARMVAPYLERHIPGRPRIVVENRGGAGGVVGANQVYNAPRKDGLTLGVFTSPFGSQLVASEGVQYDAAQLLWAGGTSETSISYVSSGTGIAGPRDILGGRQELVVGGLSPDSSSDLLMRSYLNTIGARYKYVTGYPGQADVVLAFRRGEVTYAQDNLTSWLAVVVPMVRDGQAVAVGQRGIVRGGQVVRDPRVPDIPTLLEMAVELKGEAVRPTVEYRAVQLVSRMTALARGFVFPPGTSGELVETMRKAVAETFADPEFQAASEQQLGILFEFMVGAEAQELAQQIVGSTNDDPEALEYLKRLARER
jgi:tripartite-type tricarboxylate transporter receptor subunit TctC